MSLSARLLRHPSAIVVLNVVAQSGVRFVSNVLLAQLLAPEAFALTSLTMIVLVGIQMATDIGVAVMTLRHGPMTADEEARMWTLQLVRGLLLALILFVAAEPIARLYDSDELVNVMRVLSLTPLLQGAQSLYPILRLAERDLMPSFWVEVVGRVAAAALSVLLALVWPNVWALVVGIVAQALISTVLSHMLAGTGWPRPKLDLAFMRDQWRFARWIQAGSLLTFVAMQIDKAVFPLLYGLPRFGVYGIAATFIQIPGQLTQRWSASIYYPMMLEKVKGGPDDQATLRRIRMTMILYSWVATAAVAGLSPGFFYLLYKPFYHEAGTFAALLAASFYFELCESSLRHFPLATGTSRYELTAVMVRLAIFGLLLLGIHTLGGDARLYAMAYTAAPAGSYLFMLDRCVRRGHVRPHADLALTIAMTGVVALAYLWPWQPTSATAALLGCAIAGLFGGAGTLAIYLRRGLPSLPREEAVATG